MQQLTNYTYSTYTHTGDVNLTPIHDSIQF